MHNAQTAMNPAVDAVGKMHISGNVIPNTWYQTIQTSGGKPYLNAIILLADIVYWYRPTEVRDERSGKTTGMQQKFREDLLQRSYAALSDQFGLSRKQIKDALVFLENLGVITRVFRNKIVGGQCLSNSTSMQQSSTNSPIPLQLRKRPAGKIRRCVPQGT